MLFIGDEYTEGWVDALRYIDDVIPYRKNCFYNALAQFEMVKLNQLKPAFEAIGAVPSSVNILASGIGLFLPTYLQEQGVTEINMYDYDKQVVDLNWRINKHIQNLQQKCLDIIFDSESIAQDVDLVINQSCENMWHMKTELAKYPGGTYFLFQSTYIQAKGRINVHPSLKKFGVSTGLIAHDILYEKASNGVFTIMGKTNV
jgi:hypothetical protein